MIRMMVAGLRRDNARVALCAVFVLIAFVGALTGASAGQEPKQMAITLDDLPFGYSRNLTLAEQHDAVTRVLAALGKHRIKATVFVIGRTVTEANRSLLDLVAQAGHGVGSHSYSHPDLGVTAAADYIRDIERNEDVIRPWQTAPKYFRYPFLRQGDTVDKRDEVLTWLESHGIRVAPVSIDNDDYLFNQKLVDAKGKGETVDVRAPYLDHMIERSRYYDAKGRKIMGRPVKQVLLLHMNYLNSRYLDDLLERFKAEGWSFISLEDALADEVYRLKYDYVGIQGAGHLDAVKPPAR
jgi:peptidoglycan-N-acetylglucosamine deacetylase